MDRAVNVEITHQAILGKRRDYGDPGLSNNIVQMVITLISSLPEFGKNCILVIGCMCCLLFSL